MSKHILIIALSLIISVLHYFTPTELHQLHAIFQKLYYIPIILAAYYLSLKFAIIYAALDGILYAPHIFIQWHFNPAHSFTQYIEISMFILVASILGLLFEIRRRQQVQILRQQSELAREKQLGLLGALAAGLAHEIRNPLGGLLGSAEILKEDLGSDHPKAEFIGIIETELKRVNHKLNEFLDFARPRKPEFIPNNINDIIHEVVLLIHAEAEKSRIRVVTETATGETLFPMDAEMIKQIMLNIVLNSLKAVDKGGILTIRSRVNEDGITVIFLDDGPGIPLEEIETIFEPFFTKKEKGTGLGLAISRQLAEAHCGFLTAVPSQNGAHFELRLPNGK